MSNIIVEFMRSADPGQGPSPAGNWLAGKCVKAEPGDISLEFTIRKEMTNPVGTIHGGILSLMADEVIGMATFSLQNEYMYTSVNLTIDFLSNTREGETVVVRAFVARKGRNIINVDYTIKDKTGKLIAKGTSNMGRTQTKSMI